MQKKTVVFDFDGVIHSYKSGWNGPDVIGDPVVPGIKEAIEELRKDYTVVVFSARCRYPEGIEAVKNYLQENEIVVDGIFSEKPPAFCYIDDRAILFDGNAAKIPDQVRSFKSWLKKEKEPRGKTKDVRKKSTAFCYDCAREQPYRVRSESRVISVRGIEFCYNEQIAFCAECNAEVYVPAINDANARAREEAYRKADSFALNCMRPCEALCKDHGKMVSVQGYFHRWAENFIEFDSGPGNYTMALIELDDGHIIECDPCTVRFLDTKLKGENNETESND